jgi:CubicO group peptidase (beta-lactamase class C family)
VRLGHGSHILQLFAIVSAAAQEPPRITASLHSQVVAAVKEHMHARHIPGLSLAIGADGHLVLAEGFGQADLEHGVAVTAATLFGLQSTQKLLTAAAVLRLAQAGRVSLADPVQAYCPAFGVGRWPVTLRDLLSHQAGLRPSDLRDLFNREHYSSPESALRRFVRDSLRYEPGTQVVYSNAGYTLLACVIEGATGQPYDSALARLVLRPADMRSTRPDNVFEVIGARTRYYVVRTQANTEQWSGLWTPGHLSATRLDQPANADPVDPSWAIGAGNYLGTAADLVRFGLALTEGRLLAGSYRDSSFAEASLASTHQPTGRALGGWLLDPEREQVPRMLGSSWNGSFGLAVMPTTGLVVAVASNIEFDQPADLITRILDLCRAAAAQHEPKDTVQ